MVIIRIIRVVAEPVLFLFAKALTLYLNVCDITRNVLNLWQWLDEATGWLPVVTSDHVSELLLLLSS
jgi:hypothetical protein